MSKRLEKLVELFVDGAREHQKKIAGIADELPAPALGSFPMSAADVMAGLTSALGLGPETERIAPALLKRGAGERLYDAVICRKGDLTTTVTRPMPRCWIKEWPFPCLVNVNGDGTYHAVPLSALIWINLEERPKGEWEIDESDLPF